MYDLLIKNGSVIDGTGAPAYYADVAVKDGKIVKIGNGLSGAAKTIDAKGLVVTPGFIDSHGHADRNVLAHPKLIEKIEQGITVSMSGMCGMSGTPMSLTDKPEDFGTVAGFGSEYEIRKNPEKYFSVLREMSLGSGLAFLIGHGTLRKSVMGMENRAPTAQEMQAMKNTLRTCMENGARGMSFGLYYAPGNFSSMDECVELASVVAEYDGVVTSHIRNESSELVKAVREYLTILKLANVRGVVSHHKVCENNEYWGKVHHTLHMIDEANANGQNVYCDMYPYNATSNSLGVTFLAPVEHSRGVDALVKLLDDPAYRAEMRPWIVAQYGERGFDWVRVNQCNSNPSYSGRTIANIASERQEDEIDTIFDLLRDNRFTCTGCYFTIWEDDLETVLRHPRCMICTDSGVAVKQGETHHPRMRGSFPRALGRYVREHKIVSLPEMIRKMTSMPARIYNLQGKGLIWEGMDADICIFDANTISDTCWFGADCWKRNQGLSYVLIGGEVAAENAVFTGNCAAKAILK